MPYFSLETFDESLLTFLLESDPALARWRLQNGKLLPRTAPSESTGALSDRFSAQMFGHGLRLKLKVGLGKDAARLRDLQNLSLEQVHVREIEERAALRISLGQIPAALSDLSFLSSKRKEMQPWSALAYWCHRDFERTEETASRFLKRHPRSAPALALRAESRRLQGKTQEAIVELEKACALEPANLHLRSLLGNLKTEILEDVPSEKDLPFWFSILRGLKREFAGNLAGAKEDLLAALSFDPGSPGLLILLARIHRNLGETSLYQEKLDLAAEQGEIGLWGYSRFSRERGIPAVKVDGNLASLEQELLSLQDQVRRSENASMAHVLLSQVVASTEGPRDHLRKALEIEPLNPWAHAFLSREFGRSGSSGEALDHIESALASRPHCGWLYSWKGEILRRLQKTSTAHEVFRKGLRLEPRDANGYTFLGACALDLGRTDEALHAFDSAIEINNPEDPHPYSWRSKISGPWQAHDMDRVFQNDTAQLIRFRKREQHGASNLLSGTATDWKEIFFIEDALRSEKTSGLLSRLNRILKNRPSLAYAYGLRAELFSRRSNPRDLRRAINDFKAFQAIALEDHGASVRISETYRKLKEPRRGLSILETRRRFFPSEPWTKHEMALCFRALGRPKQALALLKELTGKKLDPPWPITAPGNEKG